jgi:hypothetical protein
LPKAQELLLEELPVMKGWMDNTPASDHLKIGWTVSVVAWMTADPYDASLHPLEDR